MLTTKNIVISGTNFWNPGDDFVRDGVIRILRELFPDNVLNFLFYNFNQDYFPHSKFSGIHNMVAKGDLDQYKNFIDYIVIAGLSAGNEIKDLYQWVIDNNLNDRVYLIGAGYENKYVDTHIYEEPELTIFKHAKIITSRTEKAPKIISELGLPFHHINCPAILSVPEVKTVSRDKQIERIAFSIQLPHERGVSNHTCAKEMYLLALNLVSELSEKYQIEVIGHHKSEYFHFLNLFKKYDIAVPVIFSSYYQDLFEVYKRYDAIVTTRLHASLFANGFGIQGIILNDTDRHTHCLTGFPHSVWVNTKEKFYEAFDMMKSKNLFEVAEKAKMFKQDLLKKYVTVLRDSFGVDNPTSQNDSTALHGHVESKSFGSNTNSSEDVMRIKNVKTEDQLPVHFFTIVLNGNPFIQYHIEVFSKLPFNWHWHIIEGVADLKNDTAWSVAGGGKISSGMHKKGLSNDGTTEYLNKVKEQFPENISIYRKESGQFWNGKLEMVNAPLSMIATQSILWEIDSDELWTTEQLITGRELYLSHKEKTASYYYCHFFVGEKLLVSSKNTYGNHTAFEWLRSWRYQPGDKWLTHEPPVLGRKLGNGRWIDIAKINPFNHDVTEYHNLVFQHFAYTTPSQLLFKEQYYGYSNALKQWKVLQSEKKFPKYLRNYFDWVNDDALVEQCEKLDVVPLATANKDQWIFNHSKRATLPYKEIVVLRTDSIGDNVISLPVVEKIQAAYPSANISVICQQSVRQLYESLGFVKQIITFNKVSYYEGKGLDAEFVETLKQLNADLLLNLVYSSEPLTYEIVKYSKAKHKVGFRGDNSNLNGVESEKNILLYEKVIDSPENANELQHYEAMLLQLGIKDTSWISPLSIDRESIEFASNFFKTNGLVKEHTIAVFPFTQWEIKDYEKFSELFTSDELKDYRFILLGGVENKAKSETLVSDPSRVLNLTGQTSLLQTASLIKQSALFVGSDSSGAHLACAVGTPNIVIVGGGHFGRFLPYSELTSVVALPMHCYQCNWQCKYEKAHCVKNIDHALVLSAVTERLNKNRKSSCIHTYNSNIMNAPLVFFSKFIDTKAVEITRNNTLTLEAKLVSIAEEEIETGNLMDARLLLQDAITYGGESLDVLNDIAVINIREEKWNDAVSVLEKILNVDPANEVALENLNFLNQKLDEMKEVLENEAQPVAVVQSKKISPSIKVSAIVSTYKSEKFIRGCLDDLINQSLFKAGELEIIVIDSGSPENEFSIVSEYAKLHPNIICHRTERETLYAAWNRAVRLARGEYLTNANTDDRHKVDSFEILSNTLDANEVGIVYCDVLVTSVVNESFSKNSADKIWRLPEFSIRQATAHCPFGAQVMWRRSLHDTEGFFNESLKSAGDYEFFLWASSKFGALHVNEVLGLYYESDENLSYHNPEEIIKEVGLFLNDFRKSISLKSVYPFLHGNDNPHAYLAAMLDFVTTISISSVYPDYELAISLLSDLLRDADNYQIELSNNLAVLLYKFNRKKEALSLMNLLPKEQIEVQSNYTTMLEGGNAFTMCRIEFEPLQQMGEVVPLQNKYEQVDVNTNNSSMTQYKVKRDVVWVAPFFNPSGYASEAISFALGLDKQVPLTIRHQNRFVSDDFIANIPTHWKKVLLRLHRVEPHKWGENFLYKNKSILIHHQPGNSLIKFLNVDYCIGRTMYETDRIPTDWIEKCNEMDEIWVPSKFNLHTFEAHGVDKSKLVVIPEAIDTEVFDPEKVASFELPNKAAFNFLSVFEWTNRKGWDVLLKAYFETFNHEDDVCLYLRSYLLGNYDQDTKTFLNQKIEKFIQKSGYTKKYLPRIELMTSQLPFKKMLELYRAVDAFVLPSRGEGWGRPYMEAMSMGLPVIGTNWSGNTEFMNKENSYLIDVEKLITIKENEIASYLGHKWAQPSISHLKRLLLEVFRNPETAKEKGKRARRDIIENYNLDAVATIVINRLKEIEQRLNANSKIASQELHKPEIVWEGPQFVHSSLALINREICSRLTDNVSLQIIKSEPDKFKPSKNGKYAALSKELKLNNVDVHVRHQWPPNLNPPAKGHWVVIQPWEFGILPKEWVDTFTAQVDEMWVPSNYVKQVYIHSGVPGDRIFVIPNGFDPSVFSPTAKAFKLKTKKKFKFLFVGGTIYRKGIDLLLNAYVSAFKASDDVCLVVKDFGGDSFYANRTIKEQIKILQAKKNTPEIEYIDAILSESDLAGLYTACNALVHPYRGEGFGMPILEAMASGLPVIVSDGGACLDFCNTENALLIHAEKKYLPEKKIDAMETVDFPWLLEPSLEDLKEKMLFAVEHPNELKNLTDKAVADVYQKFTWGNSADMILTRLKALKGKPIVRANSNEFAKHSSQDSLSFEIEFGKLLNLLENNELHAAADLLEDLALKYNESEHLKIINHESLLNLCGNVHLTLGQTIKAAEYFEKQLRQNPNSSSACVGLAEVFAATENYNEAKTMYEFALTYDPGNQLAKKGLEKISTFLHEEVITEKLTDDNIDDQLENQFGEAYHLYEKKFFNESIMVLEAMKEFVLTHAEKVNPETVVSIGNLIGYNYLGLGDADNARESFEYVLNVDPNSSTACAGLGDLYIQYNMAQEAKTMFEWAVKNNPENQAALDSLAKANTMLGYSPKHNSLALKNVNPLRAIEQKLDEAEELISQDKTNEAELLLREVLANDPDNVIALNNLSVIEIMHGNYEAAVQVITKVLTQNPEDDIALANMQYLREKLTTVLQQA